MQTDVPRIAVLMTLDSKFDVVRYIHRALVLSGAEPWVMDLSLRPHTHPQAEFTVHQPLDTPAMTSDDLASKSRAEASEIMIQAGTDLLAEWFRTHKLAGAIGVGGANGSTMACGMMRALPPMVPKAMVTPVAATAAVQWYVAQSDIVMFPTIGDISLNRITRAILDNSAHAITSMGRAYASRLSDASSTVPLVGVSTFGNLQVTVDHITAALEEGGAEVIHFHASGPGGKSLESLTRAGELQCLIDLTTSELTDHITGGVYSAGAERMTAAAQTGIPQVVVPGCLDFSNWWVGEVPDRYHTREFYQYNQEILLMRTNAEEFTMLGNLFVERFASAAGPYKILVPTRGFSQMTEFATQDLSGSPVGRWRQPECDKVFTTILKQGLSSENIVELDLHINDPTFADRAVAELKALCPEIA
ncbi:MAG: Tm-1-like ATP-binding domain-containing protein [Hyphomicrobiaceae bacterium]